MNVGLILIALAVGWIGGGLVNWAADILPQSQSMTRTDFSLIWRARAHFWVLPWYWRGRMCPHCGEKRSARYPVVMGVCISLSLVMALRWGWGSSLIIAWLYGWFVMTVTVIDFEHHRVLNIMLAPAAAVVAAFSLLPTTPSLLATMLGGGVGFVVFLVLAIIGRGALGMGDVKLAGLIGMMIGYPGVLTALIIGALLGGVAALLLLISRKATRKTAIAYAPYLAFGALITMWTMYGA